ncbi:MAG TPA: uridine diphosphate-N-acetylglucosamine-binding protein YvcK [Acidimicrobiales bacterium]|nr:uridine diphosphate-N-acetylglucosamine-binding protein YvcK [Acidimicrobiales bacterium]
MTPSDRAAPGTANVVAVGGGHGLAATLRAVRRYTTAVTAVVSVADDGGSSGRLRRLLPIISPGDLRMCLVAMAEPDSLLAATFEYRFTDEELAGHALGNLILAGLLEVTGDPVTALDEARRLLGVQGRVLPATTDPVVLKAEADGGNVAGQVAVMSTDHIRRVSLVPSDPEAPPEAVTALEEADQIIMGPGSLFTSVLAAIAVPDIREAMNRSRARKVYVCNLRPEVPETEGFDVGMHVEALVEHGVTVDVALCDPAGMTVGQPAVPVVESSLARPNGLAHDPVKLASALSDLLG